LIATIPLVLGQNLCPKHCGGGEVDALERDKVMEAFIGNF